MGGSEPPYLYDAPKQRPISYPYSDFNPKAATQASQERAIEASRPKPRQNGPLVDFNKHPDSYMIVTGSQLNYDPMSKNTKKWVAAIRWIHFCLRVLGLLGAMGALFCVICLKPSDTAQGWIIRIPPGFDILVTLYAVYHLVRSSKARTPASSASYHFFALIMDAGFIPFYVFIAIFTQQNYVLSLDDQTPWTSFFQDSTATTKVLFAAFLIALTVGGLHLVAVGFDLYLVIIFRKIARLPPDMNPLEDNLTSRQSKHKYKNSEVTLQGDNTEKKAGFYSGSTLSGSTINISQSRLSTATGKEPNVRQMAFGHSRMGSDISFSPHNPKSARQSKQQYDDYILYQQSQSARNSTQTVAHPGSFVSAGGRTVNNSTAPTTLTAKPTHDRNLPSDNWYVLEDEPTADAGSPQRGQAPRPLPQNMQPRLPNLRDSNKNVNFQHQPLRMNPPTPPLEQQRQYQHQRQHQHQNQHQTQRQQQHQPRHHPQHQQQQRQTRHHDEYPDPDPENETSTRSALGEVSVNRTLTAASNMTMNSSVYSESAPELQSGDDKSRSTPKSKYYGDLAAATRAVRGLSTYAQLPQSETSPSSGKKGYRGVLPSPEVSPPRSPEKYGWTPGKKRDGRVVSRTGADIADESMLFIPEKSSRRRKVSGKDAEEGVAGYWY